MPVQSKALPQSFSLQHSIRGLIAPGETAHPLLLFSALVLLTLFAIVQVDLHSAQLQAIGLLGQAATGIDPVFLSP